MFPLDYHEQSLAGKDALFVTVINYIVDMVMPELDDDFVLENMYVHYGWQNVSDMKEGLALDLQNRAVTQYIEEKLMRETVVKSLPDIIVRYQEYAFIENQRNHAAQFGMELEDFVMMVGSTMEEMLEINRPNIENEAKFYLIIQAIAEDAGILVGEDELSHYFMEYYGHADYSRFEEFYGLPFLKHVVLTQLVLDYVLESIILMD
jgi:trigger factor